MTFAYRSDPMFSKTSADVRSDVFLLLRTRCTAMPIYNACCHWERILKHIHLLLNNIIPPDFSGANYMQRFHYFCTLKWFILWYNPVHTKAITIFIAQRRAFKTLNSQRNIASATEITTYMDQALANTLFEVCVTINRNVALYTVIIKRKDIASKTLNLRWFNILLG